MFSSDYRRDGFAVAAGIVPPQDLDAVASDIAGVFRRRAAAVGLPIQSNGAASDQDSLSELLLTLFKTNRDAYIAAARQTQYLASVHRIGLLPSVLAALADIGIAVPSQSTRPVIHFMADGLRIEGGYHKTPAHQDWRSVQGSLDGVTIWLPVYDVGLDDYPLEVVPGSHLQGLLASVDDAFGHRIADDLIRDDAFQPLSLKRRDAVFFSGFLVHRTGNQGGRRVRVALSYRFNNAADPTFVERNYPSPYTYKADMRLLDNPPSASDVAPYFAPNRTEPAEPAPV